MILTLAFAKPSTSSGDYTRVAIFINIRLFSFRFSFCKDIIDHKDILLVSFFNKGIMYWLMNVYSDLSYTAIKYLKNMKLDLRNLLIMTRDFNIHDSLWDSSFNYHSSISNDLFAIADSFDLFLSFFPDPVPTRYLDNPNDLNSVIDLMLLWYGSSELNTYCILPDWYLSSDHVPFTVTIPIIEKCIELSKWSIAKNSEEDAEFVQEIVASFLKVDTSTISNIDDLKETMSKFEHIVDCTWFKFLKPVKITRHSKSWWNDKCSQDLVKYHSSRTVETGRPSERLSRLWKENSLIQKFKKLSTKSANHGSL